MTILSEIQKWSEKLPTWQQHAVAVLYERPVPTAEDLEDILALLLDAHGIPDLFGRDARKLTTEQVAAPQAGQPVVQLTSIKNLQYVNALAPGKVLPLAPTGLTSIYGDNGVGKSGYTRVLKKACRARDQSEQIRPNAYKHPILSDTATAEFDALVDGEPTEYRWTLRRPEPCSGCEVQRRPHAAAQPRQNSRFGERAAVSATPLRALAFWRGFALSRAGCRCVLARALSLSRPTWHYPMDGMPNKLSEE